VRLPAPPSRQEQPRASQGAPLDVESARANCDAHHIQSRSIMSK
jgi:hypothetical protein